MSVKIICSILPVLIIGVIVYLSDRKEKEPIKEILKVFFMGILAVIMTLIISFIFGITGFDTNTDVMNIFIYSFICVALIEEFSKWIFAFIGFRNNKNYNYMYDGFVYFTFLSLGFALVENIIYSFTIDFNTLLIRDFVTVPGHVFFAMASGYYFTLYKKNKNKSNLLLSFLVPFLLHGFFDFCLLTSNYAFLIIFLIFIVSLYVFSITNAIKVEKNDQLIKKK